MTTVLEGPTPPNAWRYLLEVAPDVEVSLRDLGTRRGQTVWNEDGTIEIHLGHDLGKTQRHCTLAHEIQHVLRGRPCVSLCPDDEAEVQEATARWLLPDPDWVGRIVATHTISDAADKLYVTPAILLDRVDNFTDEELDAYSEAFERWVPDTDDTAACEGARDWTSRRTHCVRTHKCR